MILAAGFGTRLVPLTDTMPKALIPVAGRPMIDHAVHALIGAGCDRIVINCHHHRERMHEHFGRARYDAEIALVDEAEILGTGGGILHARTLLDGGGAFLVHNADIVTNFDLRALLDRQRDSTSIATLAIMDRPTSRAVLFDAGLRFLGKESWSGDGMTFPADARRYAFCGIHAVSTGIFRLGYPERYSDIFDVYRAALSAGFSIDGLRFTGSWHDLGSIEKIHAFERSTGIGNR